jgi:hypothetical protein
MLGQHPQLYGFPELNLFVTDTIGELLELGDVKIGGNSSYVTGLIRAVAELEFGGQNDLTIQESIAWISERAHWSTKQMFTHLLEWIYPRIGVDKSPRTALSQRALDRALSSYPEARIIHLTRHPVSTLRSLQETHCRFSNNSLGVDTVWLHTFYAHLWSQSQELITAVVRELGPKQALQVRAEELLTQTDKYLTMLLDWLNLPSKSHIIEAMKHPELSPYSQPAPLGLEGDGDPLFFESPKLRVPVLPQVLHLPSEWKLESKLVNKLDALAHQLGYGSIRKTPA